MLNDEIKKKIEKNDPRKWPELIPLSHQISNSGHDTVIRL